MTLAVGGLADGFKIVQQRLFECTPGGGLGTVDQSLGIFDLAGLDDCQHLCLSFSLGLDQGAEAGQCRVESVNGFCGKASLVAGLGKVLACFFKVFKSLWIAWIQHDIAQCLAHLQALTVHLLIALLQ